MGVRLDVTRLEKKEGPILNLELWMEAVEAARPHQVDWQWVRGHDGHLAERVREFSGDAGGPRTDDVQRHRLVAVRRLADVRARAWANGGRSRRRFQRAISFARSDRTPSSRGQR